MLPATRRRSHRAITAALAMAVAACGAETPAESGSGKPAATLADAEGSASAAPAKIAAETAAEGTRGESAAATAPRTVVLISLDTLRPDRLGVYGNSSDVSPRIDALAQESVVFEQALAPAPWTLPSHMSMLTGLDPVAHGVRNSDYWLAPGVTTLAEALGAAGFATGAFTDGGFVSGIYGFAQGFDVFADKRASGSKSDNGFARLLPPALEWLTSRSEDEDVFLFLHSFDVHAPFDEVDAGVRAQFATRPAPEDPRDPLLHRARWLYQQARMGIHEYPRLSALLNDYDAGVHVADRGVGDVLDALADLGRLESALVIVTSDHGEALFEHGLHVGHGIELYDNELSIPLIVRFPDGRNAGTRSAWLVELGDIAPTVLEVMDISPVADMQGESLLARLGPTATPRTRPVLAWSGNVDGYAFVDDEHKYATGIGLEAMVVARRHLGPEDPPLGDSGTPRTYFLNKSSNPHAPPPIERSYDQAHDPLGLRDSLRGEERLFDRRADPAELINLFDEASPASQQHRWRFLLAHSESRLLHDELRVRSADEAAAVADAEDEAAMLEALEVLGYLQAGSSPGPDGHTPSPLDQDPLEETGAETDPDAATTPAPRPPEAPRLPSSVARHGVPDMTALHEIDRDVHRLRQLMMAGQRPKKLAARIDAALQGYVAWGRDQPKHKLRVVWRLFELNTMAHAAGIAIDPTKLR